MSNTEHHYPTETPNEIIESPSVRKKLFQGFAIVSLALAATNGGIAIAIGEGALDSFPLWLSIANGVFPIITGGFGYLAQRNVPIH